MWVLTAQGQPGDTFMIASKSATPQHGDHERRLNSFMLPNTTKKKQPSIQQTARLESSSTGRVSFRRPISAPPKEIKTRWPPRPEKTLHDQRLCLGPADEPTMVGNPMSRASPLHHTLLTNVLGTHRNLLRHIPKGLTHLWGVGRASAVGRFAKGKIGRH